MKIPLGWLSMYADISDILTEKGVDQFSEDYSIHTAEVEEMVEHGKNDLIVIGKILSTQKHPDADKLSVVEVDTGKHGKHQIVCGAPNVTDAQYVAVALEGCELAPDFVIGRRELKGVDSCGMICSEDELELQPDRSAGVILLEKEFSDVDFAKKLGEPFHSLSLPFITAGGREVHYPIADTVMDLDNKFITNRPDLFGVHSNARECSAIYDLDLTPTIDQMAFGKDTIDCVVECKGILNYTLTEYKDVTIQDSPLVVKTLLHRSGLAVRNNFVDLTNLISTETAQPMHAMDADKISGQIVVRKAKKGEHFRGLDGNDYELTEDDIVIADDEKVLDLGGIMGAENCAVSETTTRVILEAAVFDAVQVRKTASRLGIRTDASMRMEKYQDSENPERAQARFQELLEFCGVESKISATYRHKEAVETVKISATWNFINKKSGIEISSETTIKSFQKLGFSIDSQDAEGLTVIVPSWRATKDVTIPEDLVEEVARLQDYNTFPLQPIADRERTAQPDKILDLEAGLSNYFLSQGLYDCYTYTFTSQRRNSYFQDSNNQLEVTHSYSEEYAIMRASIFDSFMQLVTDHHREYDRFGFFESGTQFDKHLPNQQERVSAGICFGYTKQEVCALLSGCIETIAHVSDYQLRQECPEHLSNTFHPKKSGVFVDQKGKELIAYGYVHPLLAEHYSISPDNIILFQILDRDAFVDKVASYSPLSRFPGIDREINFVMNSDIPVGSVCSSIQGVDPLITQVGVKEVYEDIHKLGEGKKSVLFTCLFQNPDKTMTDEEALVVQERIIADMKKEGIELRH